MSEYNQAVENLKSYCDKIPSDYNPDSWYGRIFFAIQTIQKQLDDGIPDVQLIISSVNLIHVLTGPATLWGHKFGSMYGKLPTQTGNILDVIEIIKEHWEPVWNRIQQGPQDKEIQIRPMTSLLLQLRQCA